MPDFFDISRHLTDEEKAIKTSVRKFVDARVLPPGSYAVLENVV